MLNYVYRAMKGYKDAGAQGATVIWTKQNPDAWDMVTRVINLRREMRNHGDD